MLRNRTADLAFGQALLLALVTVAAAGQQPTATFPAPSRQLAGALSFAGVWTGTYSSNVVPPTRVTLIFQQLGTTVTGTYLSQNGAQGVM